MQGLHATSSWGPETSNFSNFCSYNLKQEICQCLFLNGLCRVIQITFLFDPPSMMLSILRGRGFSDFCSEVKSGILRQHLRCSVWANRHPRFPPFRGRLVPAAGPKQSPPCFQAEHLSVIRGRTRTERGNSGVLSATADPTRSTRVTGLVLLVLFVGSNAPGKLNQGEVTCTI